MSNSVERDLPATMPGDMEPVASTTPISKGDDRHVWYRTMPNALMAKAFGDAELEGTSLKGLSFILLLIALVCAWLPHQQIYFFGMWHRRVSFTPDFVSGSLALAIVAPLYGRQIVSYTHHSVNNVIFLVGNLALTGTFIQILLGKGSGLGTTSTLVVMVCAIALSWLGIRAAAITAWLVLIAYSVLTTIFSSSGWGLAGFCFVASGFACILLQTEVRPNRLLLEIAGEYTGRRRSFPSAQVPLDPVG